jgi:methoxymalonate biosynthesis acyl carrier protein
LEQKKVQESNTPGDLESQDAVHEHLMGYFTSITGTEIGPDDDYFALGLIDSLRSLEIVVHVESTFGISVDVEDLDLDNFRTVSRVTGFVMRKRGRLAGSGPAGE